jgi:four helix bundle protein
MLCLTHEIPDRLNSACANAGEGFSRYRPRQFARFLDISKASLTEICEHLEDALGLGLAGADEVQEICSLARRSRGAATALVRYLDSAHEPGFSKKVR